MSIDTEGLITVVEKFSGTEDLPPTDLMEIKQFVTAPTEAGLNPNILQERVENKDSEDLTKCNEATELRTQLASMNLPGRVKFALFGNSVCRALLIRDSNKLVQQFVLKNPKLTEKEVEEFSKNPYLSDFVLRAIADSRTYMKSAVIKYNLVTNPKTPQDIAIKWLRYLQSHELKRIAKSKNVPQLVATTAKKIVAMQEKK